MRLTRQTVVFEVYNPYSIVQLSEVLTELKINQGNRETYSGRAVVTGLLNTGLVLIVSASLVDPWSDLKGLEPGPILRSFVRDFVSDWEESIGSLSKPFRLAVDNLQNYLHELSRWLEYWENDAGIRESDAGHERVLEFVVDVDREVEPRFSALNGDFEQATQELSRAEIPVHRAFAQRELHPLLMSSPFMNRAFNKPLGYAGDYEMVRMMLSEPWEGSTTFAKLVNAAALRHDAPAAHRNRISLLERALCFETQRALNKSERPPGSNNGHSGKNGSSSRMDSTMSSPIDGPKRIKILNIGCGPAVEIRQFAKNSPLADSVDFHLVDFNQETLDHVQRTLIPEAVGTRSQIGIQTEQRSVHEIIQMSMEKRESDAQFDNDYDMVYCAGLFDYFRDTTCGFLVELFYSWVKPGGLVLVTNVTPAHSSIGIMGLVLDWNLELRDATQMRNLAPELGAQRTYVDDTGVNIFLEIRKPNFE